ncbi:MAG TPA: hypothetical protein VJP02_07165 [Candidatus Sulfotelmatobacter sp.]|nr:hypothetical protein [Candidatus Sulfotelmatobacter sp.]
MRLRGLLPFLSLFFFFALTACNKPASNSSSDTAANDTQTSGSNEKSSSKEAREHKEHERKEAKKQALVVPSGTEITISLGASIGSKLSKPGDTFTGNIAKDVTVGSAVAIPQGAAVSGTVADAKPLGKIKGGAVLQVRIDSIRINGADVPVQAAARSFSEKGKGKRTAVLTGGGAALGGIIGALAGGGKGAAIGAAAGAGAGAGGSAFTGNKEIVLPAESDLTFELSQRLEVRQ